MPPGPPGPLVRRGKSRKVIIITRVVVFLIAGAIVNVAVAWGCALFVDPTQVKLPTIGFRGSHGQSWELVRIDRRGTTMVLSTRAKGNFSIPPPWGPAPDDLIPPWSNLSQLDPRFVAIDSSTQGGVAVENRSVLGCGWPARCLWCQLGIGVGGRVSRQFEGVAGAFDVGFSGWRNSDMFPRVLPLRPIWPGFAINTIFYAAILWLLFFVPGAIRKRRRITRGLCPACAYPVGASEVCTECGATVKLHRTPSCNGGGCGLE